MASRRRLGQKSSTTRAAILDAAAKVLLADGATALTSRRISQRAGIKSQLVHYYFRTMEDLIVTLMQREGDEVLRGLARATASGEPLQRLWEHALESRSSALVGGLLALARQHERVRAEALRYAEHGRAMQAEAITLYLERIGLEPPIPPIAMAFLMSAAARQIVEERARGTSLGHRETASAVEDWLRQITAKTGQSARKSQRSQHRIKKKSLKRASKVVVR
jgi:TetR/AcrR family transcriptional regulator